MNKLALPLAVLSTWLLACATPIALWVRLISFDLALVLAGFAAFGALVLTALCVRDRLRQGLWNGTLVWVLPLALVFVGIALWASSFPWLRDVATHIDPAPTFAKLEPVDAPGTPAYSEATKQRLQERYPKLRGQTFSLKPATLVSHALLAARALPHFHLDSYDPRNGRLEGTTRSVLTGMVTQLAITTRAEGKKTVLDVRARSLVHGSDFGQGVRVIRRFYEELGATWTCAPGKAP